MFVLKLAALGSVILLGLSVYPGVWVDLLLISILLIPLWLPALCIGGLVVLFLRARFARKQPLEPDLDLGGEEIGGGKLPTPRRRPLLISSSVMILSLILIVFGIPRRAAFLISRPAFETYDEEESVATLHHALDLGVDFIDTADSYGDGHNESLIGRALQHRRHVFFWRARRGGSNVPGRMAER